MAEVERHDRAAPWWALTLVVLVTVGLSTIWWDPWPFWRNYVLDMTGPAWSYILVRGLYTRWADNAWTRFFTPVRTVLLLAGVAFGIEGMQYLEVYDATFDSLDLLAYLSLLVPVFLVDLHFERRARRR